MLLSSSDAAANLPDALVDLRARLQLLPSNDPVAALADLAVLLETLREASSTALPDVASALSLIDEAAQPPLRHALKGFLQAAALKSGRGEILRTASVRHFKQLSDACRHALQQGRYDHADQPLLLAEMATRALRAQAGHLKWDHLVYGPYDDTLWRRAGAILLEAIEERRHDLPVRLRQGRDTETSTLREMARVLALHCSGLNQLPIELIDIADRIIHYLLPTLHIGPTLSEGTRFYWVPADGAAPLRIVRGEADVPGAWFFSPRQADSAMTELESMLHKGMVPGILDGSVGARERALACIRHLRRAWCDAPVSRRHRRHAMGGRIAAIKGFVALRRALKDGGLDAERWDLRDASVNGMGVVAPSVESELPKIGDLVAVRPDENGAWRLGMVRRVARDDDLSAFVGLETFASAPRMVRADDGRAPVDILLCDPLHRGGILRVISPTNSLREGAPLFVAENGAIQKLKPLGAPWRGSEFEVRTYLVL